MIIPQVQINLGVEAVVVQEERHYVRALCFHGENYEMKNDWVSIETSVYSCGLDHGKPAGSRWWRAYGPCVCKSVGEVVV